jgi:hypothetical protein
MISNHYERVTKLLRRLADPTSEFDSLRPNNTPDDKVEHPQSLKVLSWGIHGVSKNVPCQMQIPKPYDAAAGYNFKLHSVGYMRVASH